MDDKDYEEFPNKNTFQIIVYSGRAEYEETRITSIVFVNLFVLLCLKIFHFDKLCLKDSRICTNLAETAEIIYSLSNILTIVFNEILINKSRISQQNELNFGNGKEII
ncbi:hypothetical protein BpHYR1_022733 [Brachionus plicatilis]|uniref:Uncharacterized protein n=1 Tax=Brachionus plicatilis TaxID=10195 RepID=A0A3M7P902_BRAPC|nr:hypothetical protein BpHYR1_022733 [Brachionus plicatilis]